MGAKTFRAKILSREVDLLPPSERQAVGELRVERVIRGQADIGVAVGSVLARLDGDQAAAIVVSVERGNRAFEDVHRLDFERHDDVEIDVAVGVRHRLVERNAVDHDAEFAAVSAAAEATQHDAVGDARQPEVADRHAGHLPKKFFGMRHPQFANTFKVERVDGERRVGAAQGLTLHDDLVER